VWSGTDWCHVTSSLLLPRLPPFSEGRLTPPITTGHEVCAEVVQLGDGVTSLSVGDIVSAESHIPCASQGREVSCHMCQTGNAHIWYGSAARGARWTPELMLVVARQCGQ